MDRGECGKLDLDPLSRTACRIMDLRRAFTLPLPPIAHSVSFLFVS